MELRGLASSFPGFEFIFCNREQLDIVDAPAVHECFSRHHPMYCINCAAYTAVDRAEDDRDAALLINAVGPMLLAGECTAFGTKFIHLSTDYVFDGDHSQPYSEEDAVNPQTVYGSTKAEGERKVREMSAEAIIIRTSWVYSSFGKNFVKTMLRLMKERSEIGVVDDQVGSPTNARDLAEAILEIVRNCHLGLKEWEPGIFHYANDGAITWYRFAMAIKELMGLACRVNPILSEQYPTPAKRPRYSVMATKKIAAVYGVQIRDWASSLEECLEGMELGMGNWELGN